MRESQHETEQDEKIKVVVENALVEQQEVTIKTGVHKTTRAKEQTQSHQQGSSQHSVA